MKTSSSSDIANPEMVGKVELIRQSRRNDEPAYGIEDVLAPSESGSKLISPPVELTSFDGERRMMQEVLKDAIECWKVSLQIRLTSDNYVTGLRERLYREAHFWIFGNYDNSPFFSFTQICECLKLDPDFVRRCLLDWRSQSIDR
jgi:hypothetical protein